MADHSQIKLFSSLSSFFLSSSSSQFLVMVVTSDSEIGFAPFINWWLQLITYSPVHLSTGSVRSEFAINQTQIYHPSYRFNRDESWIFHQSLVQDKLKQIKNFYFNLYEQMYCEANTYYNSEITKRVMMPM